MSKKRKRYNSQENMTILRKHLLEGVPVSDEWGTPKEEANGHILLYWEKE